jgi:hypothetical protein
MKDLGYCKRRLTIIAWAMLFVFSWIGNVSAATSNWSFQGYDILLNGKTFFSKGMCYYPLPIGNSSSTTHYGDYFYNFSGEDMVWQNIVMRDIPKMRASGVNVIRLYAMWTCAGSDYTVDPLCTNKAHDIYHDRFLDLLYNNGDNPIYLLVGVYTENNWNTQPYQSQLENEYRRLATEMKDHPAVMGFMIGNELNAKYKSDPAFWQWVNKVGKMIKEIAPSKITTVALIDDGFDTLDEVNRIGPKENGKVMPHIDAWGINNYRGDSSSSGPNSGFTAGFWSGYKTKTDKPLLMTEWGVPASQHVPNEPYPSGVPQEMPNKAEAQETFIKYHYKDMVQNATVNDGIGSGGMLFMWADQWDKQGCDDCSPEVHDGTPSGPTGNFPGNWTDEEWFGIQSLVKDPSRPWDQNWDLNKNQPYPADTLVERAAFTTMKKFFTDPDPELRTTIVGTATQGNTSLLSAAPQTGTNTELEMGKYSISADSTAPWDDPDPLEATPSDMLRVTYSLLPNSLMGTDAEWYASAIVYPYKGAETFTVYNYLDGVWVKAADQTQVLPTTPSYTGKLFQLQDYEMFKGSLAPGYYEFLFGLAVLRSDWTGYDLYFDGEAIEVKNN